MPEFSWRRRDRAFAPAQQQRQQHRGDAEARRHESQWWNLLKRHFDDAEIRAPNQDDEHHRQIGRRKTASGSAGFGWELRGHQMFLKLVQYRERERPGWLSSLLIGS